MERFGGPSEQKRDSLGSGVIVDSEGYILSNYHVVAPVGQGNRRQLADKITVTLHTGEAFKGTVVGVDPESDLAVLKIDTPKALPFAKVGDSSNIRTGQWVLAIGNPFGVGKTVTSGIISATARVVKEMPIFGDYIQTDAAINPGNSGGPLVNMKGEVIGINSFIFRQDRGLAGCRFCYPLVRLCQFLQSACRNRQDRKRLAGCLDEHLPHDRRDGRVFWRRRIRSKGNQGWRRRHRDRTGRRISESGRVRAQPTKRGSDPKM